eukprot:jgi/Ulvmu1/5950/UM026_0072.1
MQADLEVQQMHGLMVFLMWRLELRTGVLKLTGFQLLRAPVLCALAVLDLDAATSPLPGEEGAKTQKGDAPPLPREGERVLEGLLRKLAAAHGGCCARRLLRTAAAARAGCCTRRPRCGASNRAEGRLGRAAGLHE